MNIAWYDRDELFKYAEEKIIPSGIVLDVGAGIRPQPYFTSNVHMIIEPYLPYIKQLQSMDAGISRKIYLNETWDKAMPLIPDKSVDSIFALDVIEHFTKEMGIKFLKEAERIARSQIIIFTPLGFYPQSYTNDKIDRWGMEGGVWQSHLSGWLPEDFGEGWDILACKHFHLVDQYEQILDDPFGAFWAIRTFNTKTVPQENRLYITELNDDLLAGYTRERLGEKLLQRFDDDLLAGYTRERLGEKLLQRFDDDLLAGYTR